MELVVDSVCKRFVGDGKARPPHDALTDVSFEIPKGEICVVVGPSGCGKSTTLRMVAGLDRPDRGDILLGGASVREAPPQQRDVAMVFQGYALYPHMTARENMEFPLKMRAVPLDERSRRIDEAASMLGLAKLLSRRPDQMSGGERQRVAMGRAIVRKPRVFLFDEPLSNLDAALRGELRLELGQLVRRLGATAMYVTHDQVEAMTLADRVVVMRAGRVEQIGAPREIYERPRTSFVATFLGHPRMNLLAGEASGGVVRAGPFTFDAAGARDGKLEVGVRPEDVTVGDTGHPLVVRAAEPLGPETHLLLEGHGATLRAKVPGFAGELVGREVRASIDPGRAHLFEPGADGARL